MKRLYAPTTWVAVSILVLLCLLAAFADVAERWIGHSYQEVEPAARLLSPGESSVPRVFATFDSSVAVIPLLDGTGDGVLSCEGRGVEIVVPEWDRARRTGRDLRNSWLPLQDGAGDIPAAAWDGVLGGKGVVRQSELGQWLYSSGADKNGDGSVQRFELLSVLGPFLVPAFDPGAACQDGKITADEVWGAAQARVHPLGTDALGRDVLVRVLFGLRVSLLVGFGAMLLAFFLGSILGIWAGYSGGIGDALLLRSVEAAQAVPFLVLVILASMISREMFLGRSAQEAALPQALVLMAALGLVSWFSLARFARGQAAALRHAPFVVAVEAMGFPRWRILGWHVFPAMRLPLASFASVLLPSLVLEEAFLSFLGLGVQPPYPSLGTLLADGISWQQAHPRLLLIPALVLGGLTLSLFILSDRLGARTGGRQR